eukprot:2210716-Alexandrium_andersonii.AAC.1
MPCLAPQALTRVPDLPRGAPATRADLRGASSLPRAAPLAQPKAAQALSIARSPAGGACAPQLPSALERQGRLH